jgi:hypothetical protein
LQSLPYRACEIPLEILIRTGAAWRSALAADLFALHPLRVESVAWVSECRDVLSAFLGLLSIAAYALFVKRDSRVWSVSGAPRSSLPLRDQKGDSCLSDLLSHAGRSFAGLVARAGWIPPRGALLVRASAARHAVIG